MGLRDNLSRSVANELDVRAADIIGADASVGDAIALMQQRRTGCVVITEHGKPIGIFTERDVVRRVIAKGTSPNTPLCNVMTRNPVSVDENCPVGSVIRSMDDGGLRHVPVVDATSHLRGVVSVKRIVEFLVEHVPRVVFNLPPEPSQKQTAREGA
jgi:CBS domain-containing protein